MAMPAVFAILASPRISYSGYLETEVELYRTDEMIGNFSNRTPEKVLLFQCPKKKLKLYNVFKIISYYVATF